MSHEHSARSAVPAGDGAAPWWGLLVHTADGRTVWVAEYDPDWTPDDAPEGVSGLVCLSEEVADALRFRDPAAAIRTWQMQSVTVPLRADGRPNRPLTAFTVELARIEEGPSQ